LLPCSRFLCVFPCPPPLSRFAFLPIARAASGGKGDKRILIVGRRRFWVLSRGKPEKEFSLLDLKSVTSAKPGEAALVFSGGAGAKGGDHTLSFQSSDEGVDDVITTSIGGFQAIFPSAPVSARPKVDVKPESRVPDVEPPESSLGGIADAYMACADRDGSKPREDFQWDFESVWAPANLRTFNIAELEMVSGPDFKALMGALKYNSWFTNLVMEGEAYGKEFWEAVADCVQFNNKLEMLRLDDVGLKSGDMVLLANAMAANKELQINSITIARNPIEDKGMAQFGSAFVAKLPRGLIKLDVRSCGVKGVGMAALCKGLKQNTHMPSTLTQLVLSDNSLTGDASAGLAQFLSSPNQLVTLDISNCQAKLGSILAAMLRGCGELQTVDLSDNQLSDKSDTKSLTQFAQGSNKLRDIKLNSIGCSGDSAAEILSAVAGNAMLSAVSVAISRNKLGTAGARAIAKIAEKLANIDKLDVSDNAFGEDGITILCKGLCDAPKLMTLDISMNFDGPHKTNDKRGPQRALMIETVFMEMCDVNESKCPIEHLVMAGDGGSRKGSLSLGVGANEVCYSMTTNEQLRSLDLSGHGFGDKGASAAGRMVTTNETLESFFWDDNNVTLPGFEAFFRGLRKNVTLSRCPLPISDIAAAMKQNSAARTAEVVRKIGEKMRFNQSPTAKFASYGGIDDDDESGNTNSEFAFLSSAGREEVQKTVFRLKASGRKPPGSAKSALKDAENQVMNNFQKKKIEIEKKKMIFFFFFFLLTLFLSSSSSSF
jgi:leucine-rich repeat-containing protein 16